MYLRSICVAALMLPVFSTAAFAYCSEPTSPSCADEYGSFTDQSDFDDCKSEMDQYETEVNDYTTCLQRELQEAIDEATDEAKRKAQSALDDYNTAVENFNNRAN